MGYIVFAGLVIDQAMFYIFAVETLASLFNTMGAAGPSMLVDGTVPDSRDRLFRLMCFTVMRSVAGVISNITNIVLLSLYIEDYSVVWPFYVPVVFCEMTAAFFLLVETKPKELEGEQKA